MLTEVTDSFEAGEPADDTLGGRIQSARAALGLSTAQLARRVGVAAKTMHNWETDRAQPRANKLQMVAGVLNVPPMWLLGGAGEAPGTPVELSETSLPMNKLERLQELHRQSA
ncbi:MAG: helix-turn-helix domain-containing protein [Rhodospirillaceae bacterium]